MGCLALLLFQAAPAGADEPLQSGEGGRGRGAPETNGSQPAAGAPATRASSETLPLSRLRLLEPLATKYWLRLPDALAAFRDQPDVRLQLKVETYRARWGPLLLTTSFELAPPGEGPMPEPAQPRASRRVSDAQGLPSASGSVELKLDLGDVGPAREVGPFVGAGVRSGRQSPASRFLRFGFGGKF